MLFPHYTQGVNIFHLFFGKMPIIIAILMGRQRHEDLQPPIPYFLRVQQHINAHPDLKNQKKERGYKFELPQNLQPEFAWVESEFPQVLRMLDQLEVHHLLSLIHTLRVACAAANNGLLSKTEQFRREIFLAGLVHDAGKLLVPRVLLVKRGKPTLLEKGDFDEHVTGTLAFCKANGIPDSVTKIAAVHHQVLDLPGKGYGDLIFLTDLERDQARRLAAADKIEAVTGLREYRTPITPQELAKMIRNETTMERGLAIQTLSAMYLSGFLDRRFAVVAYTAILSTFDA